MMPSTRRTALSPLSSLVPLGSLALLAALLLPAPGAAQAADPDAPEVREASEAQEVLEVVEALFDAMRARDGEAVARVFHPDAGLMSTRVTDDGTPEVTVSAVADFAEAVGAGGEPWDEPWFAPRVEVDGAVAQVWIFYRFYAGDTFSHCGHNSIQLVRDAEAGWRIAHLVDSRRTRECEPPETGQPLNSP